MGSIRWCLGILYRHEAGDCPQLCGDRNLIMIQLNAVKPQTDYCATGIPLDSSDFAQDLGTATYHFSHERNFLSYSRYDRLACPTLPRID
jgi:hypothetical protein